MQISKIVKDTGESLPGTKFLVKKVTGELVGEYTRNSSSLKDGVYAVTEAFYPQGYRRLDPEPQNVIVKAGELATVTFENEKLAGVRIKKSTR